MKNFDILERICHSDLVLFVCLGLIHMHICIKYEGSTTNQTERWIKEKRQMSPIKKNMGHIE